MKIKTLILLLLVFAKAFGQEQETKQETKILRGKVKSNKTTKDFDLKGFYVGVYPTATVIVGPLSKDWGNKESGIGFFQGFGGTIEIGKNISESNNAFLAFGLETWQVNRRFIANDQVISKKQTKLQTIPIRVGLKHLGKKGMLISPALGVQFLNLSTTDNNNFETSIGKAPKPCGEFKIGKYTSSKFFTVEYGVAYKFIYSKDFYSLSGPIHQFGIFAGIKI